MSDDGGGLDGIGPSRCVRYICGIYVDRSQSLFYFVPQENLTDKLARLVYMGKSVLYFIMIQRTKCLIESTSIGRITAQQSQSRVLHTSPDKADISKVIDYTQASVLEERENSQANHSLSCGCLLQM